MREQQNGAVIGTASADLTKSWDDRDTVTILATLELGPNNAQTSVLQLTEAAAQALLSDLLRLVQPAKPRFLIEVVFKNGEGSMEVEHATYGIHGDRIEITAESGERATTSLDSALYVRAHSR